MENGEGMGEVWRESTDATDSKRRRVGRERRTDMRKVSVSEGAGQRCWRDTTRGN